MARDTCIDIAKGIGMIFIVLGHICSQTEDVTVYQAIRSFVYQFHVPLFFFISGMLIKTDTEWSTFLKGKIKRLYIPFVISNIIFLGIHIIFLKICNVPVIAVDCLKHTVKIILCISSTPLGGATWFLVTLLFSVLLYWAIHSVINKEWVISVIAAVTFFFGSSQITPLFFSKVLVAFSFLHLGHLYRTYEKAHKIAENPLAGVVCLALTVCASFFNHPDFSQGQFGNIAIYIPSAIFGVICILSFSKMISKYFKAGFLSSCGRNSIWILIGHFAAFKLITILQIATMHLPSEVLFSHPCHIISGIWGILYIIAGILLPLSVANISERLAEKTK